MEHDLDIYRLAVRRRDRLRILETVAIFSERGICKSSFRGMNMERKVVHTRHVLAVKDLAVEAAYYKEKLGFDLAFTAPGWEFLSFGEFSVMLGEAADDVTAEEPGNHSWFAHALVE